MVLQLIFQLAIALAASALLGMVVVGWPIGSKENGSSTSQEATTSSEEWVRHARQRHDFFFPNATVPTCKPTEALDYTSVQCNGCEPSCENPTPWVCTLRACSVGCTCKRGLVRNWNTGECIPLAECPQENGRD